MSNTHQNLVGSIFETETATIANGESLSGAIDLKGLRLFKIVMPALWTAANLTFQTSHDGGTTWKNLYDDVGAEVTVVVTAQNTTIVLSDPAKFASITHLKVRSGTAGTAVNQLAARSIILGVRSIW